VSAPARAPGEKWTSLVPAFNEATREEKQLLEAAWRAGDLSFLLTPHQAATAKQIDAWEKRRTIGDRLFVVDAARRIGKSYFMAERGLRKARKRKAARIVYVAQTDKQVRNIALPAFHYLLKSCPPALRPTYRRSDRVFEFDNDSRIELVGLDTNPDSARGSGVDDVLLDEAGFFDGLEYLLYDVIWPQMLGRPHASVVAASSPSSTPAHYWSREVVPACIARDAHVKYTLDDADQYTPEEIEAFWQEMGGRTSTRARRELGAEHIADATLSIVPEFIEAEPTVVQAVEPPLWRDCYTSLDPGFHDSSGVLFAYWHFTERWLVVEDEILAPRMNSKVLADAIKEKEAKLWGELRRRGALGSYTDKPQPYLRISDNDLRLLADLRADHDLPFVATKKDDLKSQVNRLRVAIQEGRIRIHPRCKKLILHLKMGVWKKPGHLFAQGGGAGSSDEAELGHFDLIAALVYLHRNVQQNRNPTPMLERYVCADLRVVDPPASMATGAAKSRWDAVGDKVRRQGQKFFIRTGGPPERGPRGPA
jgi:hypothetical protein